MLQVQSFVFNPFEENTYVLYDETKECVIIDPGCYDGDEKKELLDYIQSNELQVKKLLNTHCHVDHVLGNDFVKQTFNVKLFMHELDVPVLKAVNVYAPSYGFYQYQETTPDEFLAEGDKVEFGNQSLSVLFVPGHAPGHIALYSEKDKLVVSGDVLFYNSIGRTDLPGGNFETLMESIRKKLYILPDDVIVFPGHGPKTSIAFEKRSNPFTQ
ncbi:MAG TPA: MBL fold metallo-hydrolase [Chryseolinea sp.]|nr:MBL fold metallo-hydrolase [Chryseolinea sp.]